MINGYPEQWELDKIEKYSISYAIDLINFITERWYHGNMGSFTKWGKSRLPYKMHEILKFELHCLGWSGNEEMITALEKNDMFWSIFWYKTEVGGHYYFEIDPRLIGYKTIQKLCLDHNIKRKDFKIENFDIIKTKKSTLARFKNIQESY